jgi:protease-4
MRRVILFLCLFSCLALAGCMQANVSLFGDPGAPYREQTLSGKGDQKILLVSIDGLISEHPRDGLLSSKPSAVQEVAAQLKLAREDKAIKAVLLKIDSPGGTVTASDVIYHELMAYKKDTGAKVVAQIMGLGASGGYYAALASDSICAQPTAITGSVGVIFLMPRLSGLMDKIGVGVDVSKSGAQKDMGSPFRPATEEEKKLTDAMVKAQAERFLGLVMERRGLAPQALATVSTARVFTAPEAKELGLVDSIGYMEDAVAEAGKLAGLPKDARVVAYRRRPGANPTWYQPGAEAVEGSGPRASLVDVSGLLPRPGAYALWTPGLGD